MTPRRVTPERVTHDTARLRRAQLLLRVALHVLALGRWSFALALMLPFVARELIRTWPRWRGEWPQMLVLGALGMWVCGAFVYLGGQTTSAWPASPPAAWPCCCRSR